MRAVVQRVSRAVVRVDDAEVGSIGRGFVVLLGVAHGDDDADAAAMARKIAGLRVFRDDDDRMNLALADVGGGVLLVSQFTLMADVRKGRRPSFVAAAEPQVADPLVRYRAVAFPETGPAVELESACEVDPEPPAGGSRCLPEGPHRLASRSRCGRG